MYNVYSGGSSMGFGGSGYRYSAASTMEDLMMVALILAIVGTILSFIFIVPTKKRGQLPKFFQILHDIFNFNGLIIEVILKAIYIFSSIFVVIVGVIMLFEGAEFLQCLLVIVLGPIVLRIYFELIMMVILLVKNVISINKKLKDQNEVQSKEGFEFDYSKYTAKEETAEKVEASCVCPHCGNAVAEDSVFCANCGQSVK